MSINQEQPPCTIFNCYLTTSKLLEAPPSNSLKFVRGKELLVPICAFGFTQFIWHTDNQTPLCYLQKARKNPVHIRFREVLKNMERSHSIKRSTFAYVFIKQIGLSKLYTCEITLFGNSSCHRERSCLNIDPKNLC